MLKKGQGAGGFGQEYWEANYSEPEEMDGIGNAKEHAAYLKNVFDLDYIDISSVIDFGFGLGHFFEEVLKVFIPYKVYGLEPSLYPYQEVLKRGIAPVESTKLKLENIDLYSWCNKKSIKRFDLGICTSVFQYLSEEEIEFVLPIMAERVKYLYFTVPTDKELDSQIEVMKFKDEYAIRRSRTKYQKLLRKHFTFISSRVLESKVHFDETNTFFTDLLFRF